MMGMNGWNLRVNVENGQVTRDGMLQYQAGTPWAETMPRIVACAYTNSMAGNSMAGAQATMLFTIDSLTRSLILQAPPNDGVRQPKGEAAASLPPGLAFDILGDGQGGNTAFLLAGGTLHRADLQSGRATPTGTVVGLPPVEISGITAMW